MIAYNNNMHAKIKDKIILQLYTLFQNNTPNFYYYYYDRQIYVFISFLHVYY